MTRISSDLTSSAKRQFVPWLVVVPGSLALCGTYSAIVGDFVLAGLYVGGALALAFFYSHVHATFVRPLADEVWDDGDALIVFRDDGECRIPLSNCSRQRYAGPLQRNARITVEFREETQFGWAVTFLAPTRVTPFLKPRFVEDLAVRIELAHCQSTREAEPRDDFHL